LRPLVKEQVRLFERTLSENIRIDLAGMDKRCVVYADPTRMQQVLMNLALNARDAMPDGGTLRIGLNLIDIPSAQAAPLPEMPPGKWVRLTVADSGVGIDPQDLAHIFEPFFTTKGRGEGSGLGLAQVYGIVSQHDGFIDVQSRPGNGSVFSVYLPALAEDLAGLPDLDTGPLVRGRQQTILVVEDSVFTRQALVDSLEMLNYRTLIASNGRQALDILLERGGEIDLVISDMIMPEMSGLGLVREMFDQGIAVRTVLLTGHYPGKEVDELRKRGLIELLDKPPSLEKLSETVGKLLRK
jgi:two-component system, cell cycle sensor histidine kinase and response regulator CckA